MFVEETDTRFYIKESTIPNAGYGLFAKTHLRVGDYLEIIGVQVEVGSITDQCTRYADKYKFAASGKKVKGKQVVSHTRKIIPLGYAAIVNHSKENNAVIDFHHQPKRHKLAGQAVYRFTRDIYPDEEVLGNYGEAWSGIMDWAEQCEEADKAWERFLEHDLYNLGQLSKDFCYQE